VDWQPKHFPRDGVTLAPLSSPKPTQARFYASPDPTTAKSIEDGMMKEKGYPAGGGLRGRKMYRWREEPAEHWQPTSDRDDDPREYLALEPHRQKPKQLVRHRRWVRPGVTFQVTVFLDGIGEPELRALLWLLTRGDRAPLRLGAGKPFGFGVVAAHLDQAATRRGMATGYGTLAGLGRPGPVASGQIDARRAVRRRGTGEPGAAEPPSRLRAAAPVEPVPQDRDRASTDSFVVRRKQAIKTGRCRAGRCRTFAPTTSACRSR
jgi:hypothetical protein